MTNLMSLLSDGVRSALGQPVAMEKVLLKHGTDIGVDLRQQPTVESTSAIWWHELGMNAHPHKEGQGWLLGWSRMNGYWQSFDHYSYNLAELLVEDSEASWVIDISQVECLGASKSELTRFETLADMAEQACSDLIGDVSLEGLAKLLSHREIRIYNQEGTTDHFRHYAWDGRIHLINDGGSHHFAAAKYVAGKLNQPVNLSGRLVEINLSAKAVVGLRDEFSMFPIKNDPVVLDDLKTALQADDVTYCTMSLPMPLGDHQVLMLPKGDRMGAKVSALLAQAGLQELGAHLSSLVDNQKFLL